MLVMVRLIVLVVGSKITNATDEDKAVWSVREDGVVWEDEAVMEDKAVVEDKVDVDLMALFLLLLVMVE